MADLRVRRRRLPRLYRRSDPTGAHSRDGCYADGKGYWLVQSDGGISRSATPASTALPPA